MADKRDKRTKYRFIAGIVTIFLICFLSACSNSFGKNTGKETDASSSERADTGFVVPGPESYDSADTAILMGRNEKEGTVTFLNLELGKQYTLSVDGTTRFYDKYGESISLDQAKPGDIVDVTFLKSKKHLTTLQLSPSAWSFTGIENYEFNTVRNEVSIGSEIYKLTSNTRYFSEDRKIDNRDLNSMDVLGFQGIDSRVLSVRVEKGHGYLRLVNDENFIGGWIEIGQSQIQRISEDMLLIVPEGSYQINISNKGGGGIKSAVINRNEETTLDIGDLEIPEPQYGLVLFSTDPASTEVYIDGSKVDISEPVSLMYGIHQMIARAEGYQSITQYIRVAQESAGINVVLDANVTEEEKESISASESSAATTTDYYKVYVDAPEGAEVYLNGNYVGISPCSFKKTTGTHVITLRKTGFETRSYTVQIDDEKKDLSYSFADLVQDTGNSVSANSSSN